MRPTVGRLQPARPRRLLELTDEEVEAIPRVGRRWRAAITATTASVAGGETCSAPSRTSASSSMSCATGRPCVADGRACGHGAGSDAPIERRSGMSFNGGTGGASVGALRDRGRSPRSRGAVGVGDVAGGRGVVRAAYRRRQPPATCDAGSTRSWTRTRVRKCSGLLFPDAGCFAAIDEVRDPHGDRWPTHLGIWGRVRSSSTSGDTVVVGVVLGIGAARRAAWTGRAHGRRQCATMRDGKVMRIDMYASRDEALEAVGLSE